MSARWHVSRSPGASSWTSHVAVDVLTPQDGGYHLTEVKSSSSQKEEHLPDAAVQVHVLSRSGIHITGVDVMHLNKECHFPELSNPL